MAWAAFTATRTLFRQVNARRLWPFLVFTTTGVLAIATWLGWPMLISEPYVRVPAANFVIYSSCIPEQVEVRTRTPYATLVRARLALHDPSANRALSQQEVERVAVRDDGVPLFAITVPQQAMALIEDAKADAHANALLGLALDFNRVPFVDIDAVSISYPTKKPNGSCLKEELKGTDLLSRLDDKRARVMRFNLIQDKLSDIIFGANEVLGNVLLAALALMALWMIVALVGGLRGVFLVADEELLKSFKSKARAKEDIVAAWSRMYRSLVFGRVLGPALGFLLTVSSLVAGLHPSATSMKDTFQFVSSLQLALVATFMGLLVRIIAEFALRYQRGFSDRKLALVSEP